ncbi:MAG: cytochrome c biogenesis protein ResB, partial [Candidatus Aminicenantes bacterium]|nr:cytochrome c biogenesis protein ResB [Candidatus Aminicenantes bacterium]
TASSHLRQILQPFHYKIKEKKGETELALVARKRIIGLFGADVVHLAILLILIGGLISGLFSFRIDLALHEKEITSIPKSNFAVRLEAFVTEYYPNGQVKDWKSTLTIIEGGRDVLSQTVEVNHPLNYKKYMFYQSAYGWDWDKADLEIVIHFAEAQGQDKVVQVKTGQKARIDTSHEIQVHRFLPDFVLDENKRPFSRSNEPNNPAAFVELTRNGKKLFSGWLFARFPDFRKMHSTQDSPFSLELKNYSASQYSVIHVSRDPGTSFIWAGCIFIMLGLALAFYWTPREIRFFLQSRGDRTLILAAGLANKNKEGLEKEMEKIIFALRKKK